MSMDANILPSELIENIKPLIGLVGLDTLKNSVHKSIWDAFNNNRKADRVSIHFKLLSTNYEFPVSKPKRQSYEWYHPKGILKRNWMLKHLHVLPSVVVLFQDIDWNDPDWSDKQLKCASLVKSLKNSLEGRNTKLTVVLLQKGSPLPSGEDLLASERAANLTSMCDISAKMLFVLPHNDHLMGYTLRLESAFLELAQSYYAQMSRQIRLHREQLTSSHQNLKIRHLFKLGFVSEMRMDYNNALKLYTQAYSNLDEIRIVDTNCLEIKVVAGYLNYKICKLMFKSNLPKDSIIQFKTHIERYRNFTGFKELIFEHFAWLSVQYSAFAELFCEAIKNGLAASQTQHPGIYYHKAAEFISKRKDAYLQCCAFSMSPTEPHPPSVTSLLYSDFFGVRGAKTSEPITEQQIISLIQENEKNFNHSAAIISFMTLAMAQFKANKCLRFRKKLAIDMADEYLKSGDHSKALTLYSLMLSDYRVDKWFSIFTEVLLKTLRSAYLSASVEHFISSSIEAMSPNIFLERSERILILENLWKVYQNVPPLTQSQITPELKSIWENALTSFKSPIIIDLDKLSDLFDSKITFEKSQIKYEEKIKLELFIRSKMDVPFKLKNFAIFLTDGKTEFKLNGAEFTEANLNNFQKFENEFMIEPGKCFQIQFYGENYQFMENIELQVLRLEIEMGSDKKFAILTQSLTLNKTTNFKNYNPHVDCMESIVTNTTCYIIPTFQLTTQINQINQPILVNEFFPITTNINNIGDVAVQCVGFSVTVPTNLRNKVFLTNDLDVLPVCQKLLSHIQIDIGDLQLQSTSTVSYFITSNYEGNIELQQKIWYQTDNLHVEKSVVVSASSESPVKVTEKIRKKLLNSHNIKIDYVDENVRKVKEDTIIFPCVQEIHFTARFYTLSRQALTRAFRNEDFLLRINMQVKAACFIDILDSYFISDHNIHELPYNTVQKVAASKYTKGDSIQDVKLLRPTNTTTDWLSFDDYKNSKNKNLFKNSRKTEQKSNKTTLNRSDEFNKNLLSKLPSNATIIGSTNLMGSQTFNLSTSTHSDDGKVFKTDELFVAPTKNEDPVNKSVLQTKIIYNRTKDFVHETSDGRGFFKKIPSSSEILPIFGIYCIKWRRTDCIEENESKFLIHGIEVIDPPLNLSCYIEEKMFVRTPMILKVTLKNSARKVINLIASLNNSDSFMFAGHKQINISLFSHSTYDLSFNLYPLKLGWQNLPELILEYNTQFDKKDELQQSELNNLVKRWMPKSVFIHPPTRTSH